MYCGSCMRDNTLAAALQNLGCDAVLIPTYTPIRTDEESVSIDEVFFGGINVYLQERAPVFRYLPRFLDRWLDRPWLINYFANRGIEISANKLGALAVSMLRGELGNQRKEVHRLVDWLKTHLRPDLVNLTNMLIAGSVPALKRELQVPVLVTLQGDDLFLDDLAEPYRTQAFEELRRLGQQVDGFVVFSEYYADFMADYLKVDRDKFVVVPMGLKLDDYPKPGALTREDRPPTIGYFARICPAKGFHLLVDAFLRLRTMPGMERAHLRAGGWLGKSDQKFFDQQKDKLTRHGAGEFFEYVGAPDRAEKIAFLRSVDLLTVPTTYRDPKGIFVLESLAAGTPVVVPEHGAFPELLSATGGGRLVRPNDVEHLAATMHDLLINHDVRLSLSRTGHEAVHAGFSAAQMAARTLEVYRAFLEQPVRTEGTAADR